MRSRNNTGIGRWLFRFVYVDEYRNERILLHFKNAVYERYWTFSTRPHGITSLAAQHRVLCDDGREVSDLGIHGNEGERNSEI